ncbi:MAG: hypothetical protein HQM06_10315 [Magnetococcales bacterium]|nr:hypothetical protein [Magnetococcales bacterium]
MEMIYYTAAGILLYFISDWLLERLEQARGSRFAQRSVVFFLIILGLSMASFHLIQAYLLPPSEPAPTQEQSPEPLPVKPPGAG